MTSGQHSRTSARLATDGYPQRPAFWAMKVIRCLQKTGAANRIGRDAAWLVTTIAALEDTKRYSGPVSFWNSHLMDVTGFGHKGTFLKARTAAVDSGWLVYAEGKKGQAATYWTAIPDDAQPFVGADVLEDSGPIPDQQTECRSGSGPTSGPESGPESGPHSYLYPSPIPLRRNSGNSLARSGAPARKTNTRADLRLLAFLVEWNTWHASGIVRQKVRCTDEPGKTITAAWARSQKDPEQRERLLDTSGLRAAILASQTLLKPAAWFDAAGLIGGKNANRRWYAEQLLAGVYRDNAAIPKRTSKEGQHIDTAWSELKRALQKVDRRQPYRHTLQRILPENVFVAAEKVGWTSLFDVDQFNEKQMRRSFAGALEQVINISGDSGQ
jgi:hypothetical protein